MTYKTILVHLNDSRRTERALDQRPNWQRALTRISSVFTRHNGLVEE